MQGRAVKRGKSRANESTKGMEKVWDGRRG